MLPNSVTILGKTIKVQTLPSIVDGGEELDGTYDYESEVITVRSTLPPHEAMSTLVHELFHAWLDASSINNLLGLTESQEEGLVLAFERQLLPAIAKLLDSDALSIPTVSKKRAAKVRRK